MQADKILQIFIENHQRYTDGLMRFSVADLISRKYPSEVSLKLFKGLACSDDENSRRFAYEGLDVLRIRSDVDDSIRTSVATMMQAIRFDA